MSTSDSRSGIVLELAEEFLERYRKGQRPSLKEYIDRHPSLAGEIREVFPAMALMEKIAIADESLAGDPAVVAPPRGRLVPEMLGDYRILREIGRGGMGVVYEAEQVSLGRQVALKLLPPEMLRESKQRHRFEREARAAAKLHHTNIVPVFGVGEHDGTPYYVMQFIQGLGLDEVLEELKRMQVGHPAHGPSATDDEPGGTPRKDSVVVAARSLLTGRFEQADTVDLAGATGKPTDEPADSPPSMPATRPGDRPDDPVSHSSSSASLLGSVTSESGRKQDSRRRTYWQGVARIGMQVADALDYAHMQGIVHRDVKPANLLLDSLGTVWVADFGLAKASDQKDLTHTGDLLGTLRYMPPEAFEGKSSALSDVYSLGLTLYELLAFRPAFGEKDRGRLIQQVTTAEVERLRRVNPEIPRDLETIVHKAIEREPSHRYASSGELAADLQRFLDDEPILARRLSQAERVGRWSRRHKAVAALLATLATVLTLGCVVLGLLWSRAEHSASVARSKEMVARALATKEAKARGEAQAQEQIALEKAEQLAREDYVNRVNRAYREVEDDNVALAEDLLHGCPAERRGWEWNFVERLCNSERLALDLGDKSVNALAFGPDGTWAVSGSGIPLSDISVLKESSVDIWEVDSGRRRHAMAGIKGVVRGVAVSPDGGKVAAGCSDGLIMVWGSETGQVAWSRSDPGVDAMSVAFSPDGKSLAVGYGNYSSNSVGRVKVWDAASGVEIKAFSGPQGGVNKVAYHPDGKRLAVAGLETVEVWDIGTTARLHELKGHRKWVYCLAFSPDGKWLATGGWDRTVKLRDAESGVEAITIFAHEGYVTELAFNIDGRTLVTTSEDRSIRLWDIPSGRKLGAFHGHTDFVQTVAFRPGGREIGTGSLDGSIRFWDLKASRPAVIEHTGWVERLAFRHDGLRVLSEGGLFRSGDERPKVWNPLDGEIDGAMADTKFGILPAGFSPGSGFQKQFVTSRDGKLIAQTGVPGGLSAASRSKEYSQSTIIIREAASGRALHTLTGHSADIVSLAFSPDGSRLASGCFDRTLKLWDTRTGQEVLTLRGHTSGVLSLAFSPDGHRIVSGGIDCTARVWDATPFLPRMIAEHDRRYKKKIEMLTKLKSTTDDAQRAEVLAGSGQWGPAADAFERAVEVEPKNLKFRYQLIEALVELRSRRRLAPACEETIKRFEDASNPLRAMSVVGLCRLAPRAIDDPGLRRAVHDLVVARNNGERTFVLARYGRGDLASTGVARALKAAPDDSSLQALQILLLMELGELPGYRTAAGEHLSRWSKSPDPVALNYAAWYCALAPDAVGDLAVPVRMAEAALISGATDRHFALRTLGATLYRAGRTDEAIVRLKENMKASSGDDSLDSLDWAFLAMAHRKKGDGPEAHHWLDRLRAYKPDANAAFSWPNVESRFLLREAEGLFSETLPSRP